MKAQRGLALGTKDSSFMRVTGRVTIVGMTMIIAGIGTGATGTITGTTARAGATVTVTVIARQPRTTSDRLTISGQMTRYGRFVLYGIYSAGVRFRIRSAIS